MWPISLATMSKWGRSRDDGLCSMCQPGSWAVSTWRWNNTPWELLQHMLWELARTHSCFPYSDGGISMGTKSLDTVLWPLVASPGTTLGSRTPYKVTTLEYSAVGVASPWEVDRGSVLLLKN